MMKKQEPSNRNVSPPGRPFFYFLLVLGGLILLNVWVSKQLASPIPYSVFLSALQSGNVKSVRISDELILGELKKPIESGKTFFSCVRLNDPNLLTLLQNQQVTFQAEAPMPIWMRILLWSLPIILIWRWLMSTFRRGFPETKGGGLFGITRSKAKLFVEKDISTTFADVAGVDEAKEELKEVVRFLENPKSFSRLGGRAPKGVLLVGPPGTGKTLLARALAGEAKVPFLSINGSEFIEMFVGLGAARVRDLFQQARELAPCILFIDEIDAIGKVRTGNLVSGGYEEKEQTLGQLLAEMDGFDSSQGVIILAATNRPEILDPALLRAGRFDRQVLVASPDQKGRLQILNVHSKKITLDPTINLEKIASLTPGFSGADLANLVNEAALFATRRSAPFVSESDFVSAIERIVAGLEQHSRLMHPEEKRRIAFHEMGHATASLTLGSLEKVQKVSIIPRGMGALGYTIRRPTEDRYLMDQEQILSKISVLLGGRAAEKLFLGSVSTGAEDDLVKATDLARSMVTRFGMSEPVGLASIEERELTYLNTLLPNRTRFSFSEHTAQAIDHEVKCILEKAFRITLQELTQQTLFLEKGAERLIEKETLDEKDLLSLWEQFGVQSSHTQRVCLATP